jgi:hypothetical protein
MHGDYMTAPDVYADYIKALIDAEMTRKSSLEQRGAGVVTTSGTLVTLLFGLVGVITAAKNFSLPVKSHGYLGAAIILFTIAVAIGIAANLPFLYKEAYPTAGQLARIWHYTESQAQAHIIATRLTILGSARRANGLKGLLVLIAGTVQLAALVLLVVEVLMIVGTRP